MPSTSPNVTIGSFKVDKSLNDRRISIYWQNLHPNLYAGDNFHYVVRQIQEGSNK